MVITRLHGGLGNQMFQYAAGLAVAKRLDTDLLIDTKPLKINPLRSYCLDFFNIKAEVSSKKDISKFQSKPKKTWFFNKQKKTKVIRENNPPQIIEDMFYPPKADILLDGYWQSEKYFKDISDELKKEFSFKAPPVGKNQELVQKIKECESVSVHIRRGDYVDNPSIAQIHGICDERYYNNAIKLIKDKTNNATFFFFSDDIAWVKENIRIKNAIFIDNNGEKAHEDLRLMLNCKHHIIANSTFSWWGAWLSENEDKIVVSPKKWFNQDNMDDSNIVPKPWIRIL